MQQNVAFIHFKTVTVAILFNPETIMGCIPNTCVNPDNDRGCCEHRSLLKKLHCDIPNHPIKCNFDVKLRIFFNKLRVGNPAVNGNTLKLKK